MPIRPAGGIFISVSTGLQPPLGMFLVPRCYGGVGVLASIGTSALLSAQGLVPAGHTQFIVHVHVRPLPI